MARSGSRHEPWWPLYRADRDALLLGRVRVATALVLPPVIGLTLYQGMVDVGSLGSRTWFALWFVAHISVSWLVAVLPGARRRALPAALFFTLGLTTVAAAAWRFTPQDIGLAPLNAIAIMMGSTFLFPWGAAPQVAVCTVATLGYGWAALGSSSAPGYAFGLMTALVPVMAVGAGLIETSRRASFARAWQNEQLASLARELAARVEEDALVDRVLELGGRLLAADWAAAMLHLPEQQAYKVASVTGVTVDRSWIGVEIPAELARDLLARERLVLPDDDPQAPLVSVLAHDRVRQALLVVMRHGEQIVGVLAFARRHAARFTDADHTLARAIADQAAVGLRTASLVRDLRRANTFKSEFVSTMSHELRTPLNVILGFADMAQDTSLPGAERATCLRRIEAAGRDLLGLIDSTLEIGRFEANRDAVRTEPIELPTFWDDLRAACGQLTRRPTVALEWTDPPPAVVVESDPRKLTVVLRNLIGNALKFTEAGSVRALVQVEGERLSFTVSDSGIGIHDGDRETIFEMFRQADGSNTRRFGGTGLGLYIVRRFVEQLGGTVQLDSTPGVGSTFVVSLPVRVTPLAVRAA